MIEQKCDYLLITKLDAIAWLFNIRGSDIKYNPVICAMAVIEKEKSHLFTNISKIDDEVKKYFIENNIISYDYDEIYDFIKKLSNVCLDPSSCNYKIYEYIKEESKDDKKILFKNCPISLMKAVKNKIELACMRQCHMKDGVAIVEYLSLLSEQLDKKMSISEYEGAEILEEFRKKQDGYVSLSFPTVSAFGSNAAIIHYIPEKKTCTQITKDGLYLLDTGGQYFGGTTDITRTVHFGIPTEYEKKMFTLVLKGHIAVTLAKIHVTQKYQIFQLDTLARQYLRQNNKDYYHGTGHGVGCFLNVHEDPPSLFMDDCSGEQTFKKGNVFSNEPGYYEDGKFGIRIESLMIVKKNSSDFFEFETITLVPIQPTLIDWSLLSLPEMEWIKSYNDFCIEKLSPKLTHNSNALKWLQKHKINLNYKIEFIV